MNTFLVVTVSEIKAKNAAAAVEQVSGRLLVRAVPAAQYDRAGLLAGVEAAIAGNVAQSQPGQTTSPGLELFGNLLTNGSFETGYYHHNQIPELAIPKGWNFWFSPADAPKISRQDSPWGRPETVVWNIKDAPAQEQPLFFRDGSYNFKSFGAWRPIWWKLSQSVSGLVPGATYRFTVPIFPDLVMDYQGHKKVFADDMLAGEHRLMVEAGGKTFDTGYLNGNKVPFGQYTEVTLDFSPPTAKAALTIDIRGRWGLRNNGWFLDDCSLERIS